MQKSFIRNFSIIAHVDHGKSTLADRLLLCCNAIHQRDFKDQFLDNNEIERERGITIKSQTAHLKYELNNVEYNLNLVDTPGHSDFNYEVVRSLFACENSILLVDATKGVEAQTISNFHKARECGNKIIPVINKVDLPSALIESCENEIRELGIEGKILHISAKSGLGVQELIKELILEGLPPKKEIDHSKALIVDSWYDKYLGVVLLIRVFAGQFTPGMNLKTCSSNTKSIVQEIGLFLPKLYKTKILEEGQIGFLITNIKNINYFQVGDTVYEEKNPVKAIPTFKQPQQLVFCTFYPEDSQKTNQAHEALKKYQLNDPSFSFELENNDVFGICFKCGFLGFLHIEIVKERLEREYQIVFIPTIPTVAYDIYLNNGEVLKIKNANQFPKKENILKVEEKEVICKIISIEKYLGVIMQLLTSRYSTDLEMDVANNKVQITCKMPLSEIITDFNEKIKSLSSGYSSFEYEICGTREIKAVKISILINDEPVQELSMITNELKGVETGKKICSNLKDIIPRSQVAIKIQAAIGAKIIAREDIKPYRKDVTAKCYGGDITRRKKLLEKQKKGKSKMIKRSSIISSIPTDRYRDLFKLN